MSVTGTCHFQGSLFSGSTETRCDRFERHDLAHGAWVDVARGWLPDPDDVFDALVADVPWRAERRLMYDRMVDVPRLCHTYLEDDPLPHPALHTARRVLSDHYRPVLGEPLVTAGCCYYRDGTDSVAWHGDTIGRGRTHDTIVAIVSVGDPRRLSLRPRPGPDGRRAAPTTSFDMAHGDLVVMGGSCQRTWEHAVPKVRHAGPRISVQFRPAGVF